MSCDAPDKSLNRFHDAQVHALNGDIQRACALIVRTILALDGSANRDGDWWREYLLATLAYWRNDLATVCRCLPGVGPNRHVVRNLALGLICRGCPDYADDYSHGAIGEYQRRDEPEEPRS